MTPILYFWEMSGFDPRELPYIASRPASNLATHLRDKDSFYDEDADS